MPPADMSKWSFHGNATRRTYQVRFASSVPAGAKVWIAAMWYTTRGEFSTPSTPQSVRVGEGMSALRMAA